jgi:hypothetical protein
MIKSVGSAAIPFGLNPGYATYLLKQRLTVPHSDPLRSSGMFSGCILQLLHAFPFKACVCDFLQRTWGLLLELVENWRCLGFGPLQWHGLYWLNQIARAQVYCIEVGQTSCSLCSRDLHMIRLKLRLYWNCSNAWLLPLLLSMGIAVLTHHLHKKSSSWRSSSEKADLPHSRGSCINNYYIKSGFFTWNMWCGW